MLILLQQTPTTTPASAYLLCYFPLATIVLGLITWFVLTDRHASRPYLRFNPFVAASATPEELAQRQPAVGETPAGPLGEVPGDSTTISRGVHGERLVVPKDAVPPSAAPDQPPPLEGEHGAQTNPTLGVLSDEKQNRLNTNAPGDSKPDDIKPRDKGRK